MARRRKSDKESSEIPEAPFWMTTFSDMMTLLLTFFVLIVAMSQVEVERFKEVLTYFQGARSVMAHPLNVPDPSRQSKRSDKRKDKEHEKLLSSVSKAQLEGKVEMDATKLGIHVVITDSLMFEAGSAILKTEAEPVLKVLMKMVTEDVHSIVVEGHTDSIPISTSRYPSNWELSGARSAAVVRYMNQTRKDIGPERFVAMGYGAHQPVASNKSRAGRGKNRRVEILFSREKWQTRKQTPISKQLPMR